MVEYNPKDWFGFLFRFHKADTVRKLAPIMVSLAVYALLVVYSFRHFFDWDHMTTEWQNLSTIYSILGFVISLLFVFRTNTAYDRWWEGRRQWGSLVNVSRSLSQKLMSAGVSAVDIKSFSALVPNFAYALKNHLRNVFLPDELEENDLLPLSEIRTDLHVPNQVAAALQNRIHALYAEGKITEMHFLSMQTELNELYNVLGACERIKNTPIPFSYSSFLKKFIFFYTMFFPFVFLKPMGYFLVPAMIFVFYVLASLELLAEEIEDPFGLDANDLPTDKISATIKKTTKEIFSAFH